MRHVKCDEGKPSCNRCLKARRTCIRYDTRTNDALPVAFLVLATGSNRPECDKKAQRAFQFFYEVCAPSIPWQGHCISWSKMVLQGCHLEESIKHLVIATGSLGLLQHREVASAGDESMFLFHHGKALSLLSRARNPDPTIILMACLLFFLCGRLQNRYGLAAQHARAGKKILTSYYQERLHVRTDPAIDEMAVIFSQLAVESGDCVATVLAASRPSIGGSTSISATAMVYGGQMLSQRVESPHHHHRH